MVRSLLLIALLAGGAAAEPPTPEAAVLWSFFIPGGGHFRQGEIATGAAYLGVEAGLLAWSHQTRRRLADGELSAPLVYWNQVHAVGVYTAYRNARLRRGDVGRVNPVDPTPVPKLIAAPFRWSVVKSPWVWGAALAGAGINWAAAASVKGRRSYRALGAMRLQGRTLDRREAVGSFHAYWTPMAVGAGVSEEMVFRGLLQAEWEESAGPRRALLMSSFLFGLAHLSDLKGSTVSNALFACAAGFHLGRRVQLNGYRLSEAIAAHAWFDLAAGTVLFFADPESNPIGAGVSFRY